MSTFETERAPALIAPAAFFSEVYANLVTWNDARVTRHALGKLSDRELDDIGLSRADIEHMTPGLRR